MKTHYKLLLALAIAGALTSCGSSKRYQPQESVDTQLYRDIQSTDTTNIADVSWQEFFADPYLQDLIQKGLDNNLDLKMGIERINAAQAMLKQSKAAFLPDLSIGGGLKRSRLAYPQGFGFVKDATQHDVFANTSWELDVWGKLASSKRATFYRLMQTEAVQQAVQTQLVAQIADYYYQLLTLDEKVRILKQTIENRQEDVKTMKNLKESSVVTGAAVVQSEANYYDAQADLPRVYRQIREIENALSTLIGQVGEVIDRGSFESQKMYESIQVGIPVQLLQNRPDVRVAEYELASYFEEVSAARRAFYPSLTLTAGVGFSSYEFKDWFTSTGFFANVAGGLLQPIFNKRLNKTRLEVAKANYQEKVYNFQKALLMAGQEVSDALYAYQTAETQEQNRQIQVEKLSLAVDYTKKLLLYHSSTNYTDVLTSEQSYLYAQMQITNDRLLKWQSAIKLYRALGGGVD
ncbi:TolC family protein [Myroides albus]|uniref:efflux transporter outer membrane subunit n=1 Tax=Myroides albus TaxID=2562892 RepID=UPI0021592552|nr:TolC family protein [Myroides albus]UVD78963.1 TolC family protein [Myroides albus]